MKKIKIAFIKFGGMGFGGTEKVLQDIAAKLPKDRFEVDYYYCDAAPYIGSDFKHIDTDPSRIEYVKKHGVNPIKFNVQFKNVTVYTHDWVGTDFWEIFNEDNYDVIQTGRSGHPEYPFTHINTTPIVDSIHLSGMAEDKPNVVKTVLISNEQRERWVAAGGPRERSILIPNPVEIPKVTESYTEELGLEEKFVFGLHQRDNDGIFSPIPLNAYKKVETDDTFFIIFGGSNKYKEQAQKLEIKNIKFFPTTADLQLIHKFLNTLSVYAHGRADGEQCSCAIIEALSHSLPVISHIAPSMGQAEQIADAGKVVRDHEEYSEVMRRLIQDPDYYSNCRQNAKKRYEEVYSLEKVISQYIQIYEGIVNTEA